MAGLGVAILVIMGGISLFLVIRGIRLGLNVTDNYNTSGKMYIIIGLISLAVTIAISSFCFVKDAELKSWNSNLVDDDTTVSVTVNEYDSNDDNDESGYSSGSGSFTNKFGTRTTKCVVSGCDNYIAKSGDTNCCTLHSNKCGECSCYIDGDAMYCMDCLSDAVEANKSGSSSGSFTNKYGTRTTKCVVSGCDNYIANSGDSNCCTLHSNKCGECYCYIDGDAMYCMDCLSDAVAANKSDYSSGNECYVCGEKAYSKYGSYYYCSDCMELVKAFSE